MPEILFILLGGVVNAYAYFRYRLDNVRTSAFLNPLRPQEYLRPPGPVIHWCGLILVLVGVVVTLLDIFL